MPRMPRHTTPRARSRNRGLTLVELMIALTVGLVLIGITVSVFMSMRASYGFQDGLSRVQENGRFATLTLSRELRMAGYQLCPQATNMRVWLNQADPGYLNSIYGNQPVIGWEASGTAIDDDYTVGTNTNWASSFPGALPPLVTNPTSGSDIIVIKRETPVDLTISNVNNSAIIFSGGTGIGKGMVVTAFQADCGAGDRWMNTNAGTAASLPLQNGQNTAPGNNLGAAGACDFGPDMGSNNRFCSDLDTNAFIVENRARAYYIRDNPAGEPSLYFVELKGTPPSPTPVELVQGVENMQILYGEDTDSDRTVDVFNEADNVGDWGQVVAVRIALLLRNDSFTQTETDLRAYDIAHTDVTPVEEGRVRQVMTVNVALRNRLP